MAHRALQVPGRHCRRTDAPGRLRRRDDRTRHPKRVLAEAVAAASEKRPIAVGAIVDQARIPAEARSEYAGWVAELADHYADLLSAAGRSFEEMVRAVFKNRTNYLLCLRRLGEKERRFHAALEPGLETATPGAGRIISRMGAAAETLRKEHAAAVFT